MKRPRRPTQPGNIPIFGHLFQIVATRLARISHRFSTATADKATLPRLFSTFDLDVTRHAVVRKPSNKSRHSNLLHRLATKPGERCGLGWGCNGFDQSRRINDKRAEIRPLFSQMQKGGHKTPPIGRPGSPNFRVDSRRRPANRETGDPRNSFPAAPSLLRGNAYGARETRCAARKKENRIVCASRETRITRPWSGPFPRHRPAGVRRRAGVLRRSR